MDNVEQLETLVRERYQAGLLAAKWEERDRAIQGCISDVEYLTDRLESVSEMDIAGVIADESSASLKQAVGLIRKQIAELYAEHQTALAVLPFNHENLGLVTKFVKAVHRFEVRAFVIVSGLEKFELITGVRNQ